MKVGPTVLEKDNLVVYYDFKNIDYDINSNIIDKKSKSPITLYNTPIINDNNIKFDGVNDYFGIPYTTPTTESFLVDLWIKPSDNTAYLRGIFTSGDMYSGGTSLGASGWSIGYHSSGNSLTFGVAGGSSLTRVRSFGQVSIIPEIITNIVMYRNLENESIDVYLNGQLEITLGLSNTFSLNGISKQINHRQWSHSATPNSEYYMIKVYHDVTFTQDDILRSYNAFKTRFI